MPLIGNPPVARPMPMMRGMGVTLGLKPDTSVGVGTSSVPYGPTNGYATPNGVTGFVGPAAGSLRQPTSWYVRSGGSNNNGGSSTSLAGDRSGSDGAFSGNGFVMTSASAAFTSADVGKGICVGGAGGRYFKIVAVTNATTVTLDHSWNGGVISGLAWVIGGSWADLRPAIGDATVSTDTTSPVLPGDTVYVGAGTFRKTQAVQTSTFVFNGQVSVVGDVTGQYTGDAGMVQLTAYTTNDKTAPSATTLLNLNGKSNLAFSNIMFVGGNATMITATVATSQNITFTDCALVPGFTWNSRIIDLTTGFATNANWLLDRCYIGATGIAIACQFTLTTGAGGNDYDANVTFKNSLFFCAGSTTALKAVNSGTLAFKGGGLKVRNCSFILGNASALTTTASQNSTIFPCTVFASFMGEPSGNSAVLSAGTSGQIVENYNLIVAPTARANVTAGANSVSDGSYAPLFHFGQERIWGQLLRRFGEPMAASPLLGFGNDGSQTPYDLANRPRPAGGGSGPFPAVGALERGNTAAQATSPVPPQGTNSWQFTGPGFQDFLIPVDNTSTTVSISVQRDSAYSPPPGQGNPALLILANGTLGVTAQTVSDTGASGGWNTLTAAAFTPSGPGWLTVRVVSYDGSGASVVSFADFTIT